MRGAERGLLHRGGQIAERMGNVVVYPVVPFSMAGDPIEKNNHMRLPGTISLQSESHPVEFRKVELLNLVGCMDPKASNYKSYYVVSDNSTCRN